MPKKTNKTSHVLNLITSGTESETEEQIGEDYPKGGIVSQKEKKEADRDLPESSQKLMTSEKTIVVVDAQDDKISNKILDQLTDHLEDQGKKEHECKTINIMEQIIDRIDLDKQMEQYGMCMCKRCRADVRALILTSLPAKYVVVYDGSRAPIIGFYENKFKVRIFTEVLKSCMVVKENPRHDR